LESKISEAYNGGDTDEEDLEIELNEEEF